MESPNLLSVDPMPRSRQLAAIMFTDIVGYTALMQQNEEKAIQAREKHRHIFNSATERYRGRILQYYGDGTLSVFDSAVDAVNCGIDMQRGFQEEPGIPVRIGIHIGDIIVSEEEIIGDGVNIASRIESLAIPGSVLISEKVYDEIKNQAAIQATRLKSVKLKNVARPIEVYAITNDGLQVPRPEALTGKVEPDEKTTQAKAPDSTQAYSSPAFLLTTKLYAPPPNPNAVLRPRLMERLNQGLNRKLTLISAPAGFGKTTLVSEWIAAKNQPTAWLSLDESDQDAHQFLAYLLAALQTLEATIGAGLMGLLQSPQPPPNEVILTTLINEIAAQSGSFCLVLDDYHLIESQAIDQALAFLLDHQPRQLHLIITTREDPQLPLARLRARGQLSELRIADLRFTAAEASEFLNQQMGLQLTPGDIAALETRTEGWIAGLQLAAISLQGHSSASHFIQSFTGSHRFVLDYLIEEVLQQQPESVQTFLLRTSILDRLSGPLCDAVLLDEAVSGHETLAYLEHANLFVVPLDEERKWYRYHHLFADVLRAHSSEKQQSHLPLLHRRASDWYEANGLRPAAIHHALAAQDLARAADLTELAWPAMDASFQSAIWMGWMKRLPEEMVRLRPVLSLSYAWGFLNAGELEEGTIWLNHAEYWTQSEGDKAAIENAPIEEMHVVDQDQFKYLASSIATARSYLAHAEGDVHASVQQAQRALELMPGQDLIQHGQVASLLGLAHWANGDLEAAHKALSAGMADFRKAGNPVFAISGTYGLADIRLAQGRLQDAFHSYEQALQLVLEQGDTLTGVMGDFYLGMGDLQREMGKMEAATLNLQKSEELGEEAALPDWPYRMHLALARMEEAKGDFEGALTLYHKAESLYYRTPIPMLRPVAALRIRPYLRLGKLAEAQDWVQERGLTTKDELSFLREFEHLCLARVLVAADQPLEALGLLKRLLAAAETPNRMGSILELLVQKALAHEAQAQRREALKTLERALILAEPEGYVRLFLDEGLPMQALLAAAADQKIKPKYVRHLLAISQADELRGKALDQLPPNQALPEPLSERELEVLQLIALGCSNREISDQLFVSLSTIKGHNQNIFGKLQVKRRTEAVARAKALGLL